MDIYVEPYLPRRKLVIFGHVPIVAALSKLAKILDFNVVVVDKDASKEKFAQADLVLKAPDELASVRLTSQTYVVIATMGELDQEYAAKLVGSEIPYIGIVAGKKRASDIFNFLSAEGIPENQSSKIKSPAGIYMRAVTAEEIALSIIAEIIELSRAQRGDLREYARTAPKKNSSSSSARKRVKVSAQRNPSHSGEQVIVDPVCGMTVDSKSNYSSKIEGRTIVFCSGSCKEEFDRNHSKYLLKQKA
jgi:xanthine dehydrogenase accessory factor